ncbi:hypothetical protein RF11_15029 [Thelohanellus kitauei]|uniref:Calcineurin-like phosphoesterase domain-containing protein n=1 Tax=Thelohanellus kitauei TaxID=669202 RepID=A0A0C2MHH7_THEKT|nr:hypothetical protein RF11_15029 [Thelohanellus kitauei]
MLISFWICFCLKAGENYQDKTITVDKNELNIVVMGDYGISESSSSIKRKRHAKTKYDLGIVLGDNVYEFGFKRDDFTRIKKIFTDSFPKNEFDFDFLTLLGNHEYYGDIETGSNYTFMLMHHNIMRNCGPHNEHSNNNFLNQLTYKYDISACIGGHNHNMQVVIGRPTTLLLVIVLSFPTPKRMESGILVMCCRWCYDSKGGFGQLRITRDKAYFEYIDEDGNILKNLTISPKKGSRYIVMMTPSLNVASKEICRTWRDFSTLSVVQGCKHPMQTYSSMGFNQTEFGVCQEIPNFHPPGLNVASKEICRTWRDFSTLSVVQGCKHPMQTYSSMGFNQTEFGVCQEIPNVTLFLDGDQSGYIWQY